jgi:SNF2 family DNA or RNA helicase
MIYIPHNYQTFCTEFIKTHSTAALFLDMGLGKTVITLTAIKSLLLDSKEIKKVLVIAPLRVTSVWSDEVKKWDHLKMLTVSQVVGTEKKRLKALNTPAQIYTINRENIKWLVDYFTKASPSGVTSRSSLSRGNGFISRSTAAHYPAVHSPAHRSLNRTTSIPATTPRWEFDMAVIDELSSFKSFKALRWKIMNTIRPVFKRIVGLTGTPSSNGLMDLWAEIKILDEGERLGHYITRYREAYFRIESMNPHTGIVYKYAPKEGSEELIYKRISDIAISMKALDYLDLPKVVYNTYEVELGEDARFLYEKLKTDLLIPFIDGDVDAANAVSLSGKLLQMSNGAVYDENKNVREIHKSKLEALEDLIEAANGQSVLIAYWFKHDHDRIVDHLKTCGISTREIRSDKDIADWNRGSIPVALIHPASAGHGLNIQAGGHILIWFGLTWSLELYLQTNARLWRQGQKYPVIIQHIVVKNSMDERVLEALSSKNASQERLIAAVKANIDEVRKMRNK